MPPLAVVIHFLGCFKIDTGNFESPRYDSLKNTGGVVPNRHLPHLLDVVLAISAKGILSNITVVEVKEFHTPNTCSART